jgi:hypothetical protein
MKKTKKVIFNLAAILVLTVLLMEAYTRTADKLVVSKLNIPPNTEYLVLLFHGAKDENNPEMAAIAEKFNQFLVNDPNNMVINYDWSSGANNRLRAGSNAIKYGEVLGLELGLSTSLKNLTIIAHSASGFIPDKLCRTYRDLGGLAYIDVTYLDAFGLRGFADTNYGARNHGKCADFAVNIVNTDDPAPTTNKFFSNAWNLDVTGLQRPRGFAFRKDPRTSEDDVWLGVGEALDDVRRNLNNPEQEHNGHYWPPYYLLMTLDEEMAQPNKRDHNEFPRGSISIAKPLLAAEE